MNKVDDGKKVQNAFNTIRRDLFENVQEGRVVGLDLWKYVRGDWIWFQTFKFVDQHNGEGKPRQEKTPAQREGERYLNMAPKLGDEKSLAESPSKSPGLWKKGMGYAKEKGLKGNDLVAGRRKSMGVRKGLMQDYEW